MSLFISSCGEKADIGNPLIPVTVKSDNTPLNLTEKEKQFISGHRHILLGAADSFPPFIIENPDGSVQGFDVDILKLISLKTGLDISLDVGVWKEKVDKAKNGDLDGLTTTVVHDERREYFNFSDPYISAVDVVFIKKGNPSQISRISDLKGKRAGVQAGNLLYEKHARNQDSVIVVFDSVEEVIRALVSGEVDYIIYDEGFFYIARQFGFEGFIEALFPLDNFSEMVFSLDKNHPELLSLFNKALAGISVREKNEIRKRWFDLVSAETGTVELTEEEKSYIAENPVVTLGGSFSFDPYFIEQNGQTRGIVRDLLDLVEERTGLNIEIDPGVWSEQINRSLNGEIRGLGLAAGNASFILKNYLLTTPFLRSADFIIVKKGNPFNISQVSDLAGKRAATFDGSAYYSEFIEKSRSDDVRYYSDGELMIRDLISGSVDYVVMTEAIFYTAGRLGLSNFIELAIPLESYTDISIALNKKEIILQGILNKALEAISAKEILRISSYWLGGEETPVPEAVEGIEFTENEQNFLAEHKRVKIGALLEHPPLVIENEDGDLSGIVVELIRIIYEKSGLEIELLAGDMNELNSQLADYKIDGLVPSYYASEREDQFLFSYPFIEETPVVIVKKGNPKEINDFEECAGNTLVMMEKTPGMNSVLESFPDCDKIFVEDNIAVLQAIISGEADFTINFETLFFYAAEKGLDFIDIAFAIDQPRHGLFTLRRDWIELTHIINKCLDSIPVYQKMEIRNRWFSTYRGESERNSELNLTVDEWKYLEGKESLKISVHRDFLPFEGIDREGEHEGISSEVLHIISRQLNIPIELVYTESWIESQRNLMNRTVDLLPFAQKIPARRDKMDFTTPYITEPYVVVTRNDELFIEGVENLIGHKVGIISGIALKESLLNQYSDLEIVEIENIEDGFDRVQEGDIFAFIDILNHVAYSLQNQGRYDLKIAGRLEGQSEISIATRNDEPHLGSIMEKAVLAISNEEMQEIYSHWFSITFEQGFDYSLIKQILIIVAIVLAVIFTWVINLNREVRRRKTAENELRRRQDLIDSVSDIAGIWFWILNPTSGDLFFTEQAMRHLGTSIEEEGGDIIKWDDFLYNMVSPDDQFKMIAHFEKMSKNSGNYQDHLEYKLIRRDKEVRDTVIYYQVFYDEQGFPMFVQGSSIDISESKNRELQLKQAKSLAESAAESKSVFLANMSHEIRTPMNGILGLISLLLRTELDLKQKKYIESINHSAESLLRIINDILDFSKVEAGKLEIEKIRFDLFEQIDNVLSFISLKAAEKKLELLTCYDKELERFYLGDPLRLTQVLTNLLSNAVKFTNEGSVSICVKPASEKGKLHFEVRDTGIGLTEDQQKNLFQSFAQGDGSTTRKYGGTGLGLAICRQLVELMHGTISVESLPEVGSIFIFEIELDPTGEEWCYGDFTGKRVLIIDENIQTQKNLSEHMNHCGIDVYCAGSGSEALSLGALHNFDLILLNWNLPDMNGIEVNQNIHELLKAKSGRIPPTVIMVGGFGQESVVTAARDEQIFSLLYKPLNPSLLQEVMVQAFDSAANGTAADRSHQAERGRDTYFPPIREGRILLVEDNITNRQIIMGLLEDSNVEVHIAENGLQAVEIVKTEEYDLILMDIQMPVMDGYSAAVEIRRIGVKTPIVALSANAFGEQREKALECGMNGYLCKPVDVGKLYALLLKYLEAEYRGNSTEGGTMPAFKTLNIETGLRHFGGNSKLYSKILEDFCSEFQENINWGGSYEDTRRSIHTLKGLSGNIGAVELCELCSLWEKEEDRPLFESIKNKLSQVCSEIELLLKDESELKIPDSGEVSAENDLPLNETVFKKLKLALRSRRPALVQQGLDEISEYRLKPDEENLIIEIRRLAEEYKFEEAEKLL